jgi:pre-mRNA cleavage complex 2 protein Pcf11
MAKTEERGWYIVDFLWTGESKQDELGVNGATPGETQDTDGFGEDEQEADPSTFTMPADESKDRCVICGINFKMFFDNDDGIYRYSNCREIDVINDDAAEKESDQMLVHVSCWRGLGSPPVLSMDQALQEATS